MPIPYLQKRMTRYKDNVYIDKAGVCNEDTEEGIAPILELIEFLEKQEPVGPLICCEQINKAAQVHADDLVKVLYKGFYIFIEQF